MNEYERLVWALTYAVAMLIEDAAASPSDRADNAVINLQKAEQRFSNDFPTPPEKWDDEDLPF